MTAWIFILVLNMPTFGGQVIAQVETLTRPSCEKLRKVIVRELGGEENINGSVSVCQERVVK